jgi:hypothetical protein
MIDVNARHLHCIGRVNDLSKEFSHLRCSTSKHLEPQGLKAYSEKWKGDKRVTGNNLTFGMRNKASGVSFGNTKRELVLTVLLQAPFGEFMCLESHTTDRTKYLAITGFKFVVKSTDFFKRLDIPVTCKIRQIGRTTNHSNSLNNTVFLIVFLLHVLG